MLSNILRRIANAAGGGRATSVGDRIRYLEKSGVYMAPFGMHGGEAFFVSPSDGNDKRNGDSWDKALKTVGQAASLASSHDTIFVRGTIVESLVTPDFATGPNEISLIGCAGGMPSMSSITWTSDGEGEPCIDLNAARWDIQGFRFNPPVGEAAIKIHQWDGGVNPNNKAPQTRIHNNTFFGLAGGLYGINIYGGAYEVHITDNIFSFMIGANARCITATSTSFAVPYRTLIANNQFHESRNHVVMDSNAGMILGNVFQDVGGAITTTTKLKLTSVLSDQGKANMVHGNYFGGEYTTANGYVPATGDDWGGNYSMHTGAQGIGPSGGTIAVPTT